MPLRIRGMFGQVVIGPPGSGKSTYCTAMRDMLTLLRRPVACVNVDPANDSVPYVCEVDIRRLIDLSAVMDRLSLGPNGALIYCMEYLETHMDWLKEQLDMLPPTTYLLFDFPGQVELYTHHDSVKKLLKRLEKWGHRLVTVHLTDAHYCSEPGKFVSVLMTALTTMVQLETPHLNVLSKIDLLPAYGPLPFSLEFFTDVLDLRHLLLLLDDDPFLKKYKELNAAICGIVEDFNLVNFIVLNVNDKESMLAVLKSADQANGYCFYENQELDVRQSVGKTSANEAVDSFKRKAEDMYCP